MSMFRAIPPIALISLLIAAVAVVSTAAQVGASKEADVTRCWAMPTTAAVRHFSADGVRMYAVVDAGRLVAFSRDGKMTWTTDLGGDIVSNLLNTASGLILGTSAMGDKRVDSLRSISRETGIVAATASLPVGGPHYVFVVNGSVLIVSGNGIVQLMDTEGAVKWRREIATAFTGMPALSADRLFVASAGKQLFSIDPTTGEINTVRKMKHDITALAVTQAGVLAVGDDRGGLTALDRNGATAWRLRVGASVSRIFATDGHLIATSHDNFVYCIDASNGSVVWKRRLSGRVSHAAAINGDHLFTTSIDEHGAAITDIVNGKSAGQIIFADDEFVTAEPEIVDGVLVVGTNKAVYGYSLAGPSACPK